MGFWHPATPETTKFSYNVIVNGLLVLSAAAAQLFDAWLAFAAAMWFYLFIYWQLYFRFVFLRQDDVSEEDKNRIAFHEMLTGDIGRVANRSERVEGVLRNQSTRLDRLERLLTSVESKVVPAKEKEEELNKEKGE